MRHSRYLKSKGVKHFGIHSFLASNTVTNEYYPTLAKILFELAVELKEKTGADIKFINLSGGVGVAYTSQSRKPNDISVIGEGNVHKVYDEVLIAGRNGRCCNLYRAWTFHARTLRMPCD